MRVGVNTAGGSAAVPVPWPYHHANCEELVEAGVQRAVDSGPAAVLFSTQSMRCFDGLGATW